MNTLLNCDKLCTRGNAILGNSEIYVQSILRPVKTTVRIYRFKQVVKLIYNNLIVSTMFVKSCGKVRLTVL